ncbi:multidrug effflux MFS transporter [Salibacterium halotolerans]|uniref:Bcr/CflA family efflux transporter n=1 Tax=Salibacterium halotolerans TaxID=1884432 RepID=A0A1I5V661_9BACI|nr:multidrug effflux MFS transporter [Salibacterium halotolerans]SFQ02950.1 MFS transporter, DHA1 family, bicyclomycin/chloramphenicol resistance protein [Salibacterium halotolerans]
MEHSAASAPTLSKLRRIWMAVLLGSLAAFGPLTIDMYLPSFPSIANDLDTTASSVQLSLTACLLGLAGGQLVIGPISDMKGRKTPMIISLGVYAAASFLCVFAPSIWVLIASRFLQGFSASAGIVISRAVVRDLYTGKELTKFFALLMLVNGLAPILAPLAGGIVLNWTSWQGIFVILSVIGLFMLTTVFLLLPETLADENKSNSGIKHTIRTFGELMKDRTFAGYALAQGLVMAGIFAYVSGTPFVYQGIYGVSAQVFSILFAMNGIGLIIGSQLTGRLAGFIDENKILKTGLFVTMGASIFLLIMILLQAPLVFIVIPIFLVVSCVGVVTTTCFSLAMETQGHRAGSASALLGLLPFLFGATSAPLVGVAGEGTALPMGLIIFIADALALSCYLFLVRKPTSS